MHLRSSASKALENLQFCGKIYYLAFLAEHSSKAETVMTSRTFLLKSVFDVGCDDSELT